MSSNHVAVCGDRNRTMECVDIGVQLLAEAQGRPYYVISADKYHCRICGKFVYSEFGVRCMHYQEPFQQILEQNKGNIVRIA